MHTCKRGTVNKLNWWLKPPDSPKDRLVFQSRSIQLTPADKSSHPVNKYWFQKLKVDFCFLGRVSSVLSCLELQYFQQWRHYTQGNVWDLLSASFLDFISECTQGVNSPVWPNLTDWISPYNRCKQTWDQLCVAFRCLVVDLTAPSL